MVGAGEPVEAGLFGGLRSEHEVVIGPAELWFSHEYESHGVTVASGTNAPALENYGCSDQTSPVLSAAAASMEPLRR
jgi:hypothetical protein